MKSIFVLALSLLFVEMSHSQPLCDFRGKDSLFVQVSGDTTNIWDLSLCAYCSTRFVLSVSTSSDSIFILQSDTARVVALCGCIFDQRTSFVGLSPGKYWVILRRAFYRVNPYFVRAIQFERLSGGKVSKRTESISWTAFQSGCIPDFAPEEVSNSPNQFALLPNYPNPFNPSTSIQYQIPTKEYVVIKVFNLLGQEVQTLLSEPETPGLHSIRFYADQEMSSGIYYCRMVAGSFSSTRRMVLMR